MRRGPSSEQMAEQKKDHSSLAGVDEDAEEDDVVDENEFSLPVFSSETDTAPISIETAKSSLSSKLAQRMDQKSFRKRFEAAESIRENMVNRQLKLTDLLLQRTTQADLMRKGVMPRPGTQEQAPSKSTSNRSFFGKRNSLAYLLTMRPDRSSLEKNNILKGPHSKIAAQQLALRKQKRADRLNSLFKSRPNRDELLKQNILRENSQIEKEKQALKDAKAVLGSFLSTRTQAGLMQKGLLRPKSSTSESFLGNRDSLANLLKMRPDRSSPAEEGSNQTPPHAIGGFGKGGANGQAVEVACGWGHTLVRTADGLVYTFGELFDDAPAAMSSQSSSSSTPAVLDSLADISTVASGDHHAAAVSAKAAAVFVWGQGDWCRLGLGHSDDQKVPQKVSFAAEEPGDGAEAEVPMTIACGVYHTLVATKQGNLFGFGWDKYGRIGCSEGLHNSTVDFPTRVPISGGAKVVAVACGQDMSAAVTAVGRLLTWGSGSWGRLGSGEEEDCPTPTLVPTFGKVTGVACGEAFCVATTEEGGVFSWGSNSKGQLGRSPSNEQEEKTSDPSPRKGGLRSLRLQRGRHQFEASPGMIQGLTCGPGSCIAAGKTHALLVDKDGALYSWGSNIEGVLGLGKDTPKKVFQPMRVGLASKVIHVATGTFHSAATTEEGGVYCWGSALGGRLGHGDHATSGVK